MADVVLFHRAHGLTPGVESFAERLRAAGRTRSPEAAALAEQRVLEILAALG